MAASPGRRRILRRQEAARRCPACGAHDPAVAISTKTTTYLLCRACEHVWQTAPPDAWTSMAFRITRQKMTRKRH